jgi:hypothetical protein
VSDPSQVREWASAATAVFTFVSASLIGTIVWAVNSFRASVIAQTRANDRLVIALSDIDTLKAWRAAVDARITELETQARINAALHEAE